MNAADNNPFRYLCAAASSDIGRKRKNNEDSFGCFPSYGVWCVADGMGGGDDGEVASAAVVKSIDAYLSALPELASGAYSGADVAKGISRAVGDASAWIFKRARKNNLKGCGSTFVGVVFDATAPGTALALHVGDSRLYRLSGKDLKQITKDHSVAEMMGAKDESDLNPMFRGMILRAVGIESAVDVEATPFSVKRGDYVLICSDGLTRMVSDKRIVEIIQKAGGDVEVAVKRLVAAANEAGGVDNVTVELISVGNLPQPVAAVPVSDELGSGSTSFTLQTLEREMRRGGVMRRIAKPLLIVVCAFALALFAISVSRSFMGGGDAPVLSHEVDMTASEPHAAVLIPPASSVSGRHVPPRVAKKEDQPAPVKDEVAKTQKVALASQVDAKADAERLEAAELLKVARERRERDEKAAAAKEKESRQAAQNLAEMYVKDDFVSFANFANRMFGREAGSELQKRGLDFYSRRNDVDVCEVAVAYVKLLKTLSEKIADECVTGRIQSPKREMLMQRCADVLSHNPADLQAQEACIGLIEFVHRNLAQPHGAVK